MGSIEVFDLSADVIECYPSVFVKGKKTGIFIGEVGEQDQDVVGFQFQNCPYGTVYFLDDYKFNVRMSESGGKESKLLDIANLKIISQDIMSVVLGDGKVVKKANSEKDTCKIIKRNLNQPDCSTIMVIAHETGLCNMNCEYNVYRKGEIVPKREFEKCDFEFTKSGSGFFKDDQVMNLVGPGMDKFLFQIEVLGAVQGKHDCFFEVVRDGQT